MLQMWLFGAAIGWSVGAGAADKLAFAPPPGWVVPVAIPKNVAPPDAAALGIMLLDEQYDLRPGALTRYSETVFRIQSPQGLAAGGVSFAWNPDTQTPVVHKLLIRRGDQTIDVLKGGQTFTVVRRESNLENAVLDGVLTATIQPEGLQVGDAIDFAVSITEHDPAIGDHVEQAAAAWNGATIARAHLAARWPAGVRLRLRAADGTALPKPSRSGGVERIEITSDDVKPLVAPRGAPARYQQGRLVEMTDLAAWSDAAAIVAPLFAKAAVLPATGPLQDEVARIRAASADPKTRAEAALKLVEDRVRYVALLLNDGGLVPADTATTWARRFGDCKAKTVLLVAILRALGIQADPVLVSVGLGDGLDRRLPMVRLFNHVLVRAVIAGRTYWLDGTRSGDARLDDIQTPDFGWGLPLVPGATLVPMRPAPLATPAIEVAIRIDARGGISLPAPVHIDRVMRGDAAVATNVALANVPAAGRDEALRTFWKQMYDFAEPKSFANDFDPVARTLTMRVDGTTSMDWNQGFYEADHVWVGYKADFARDPGADKSAPYAVAFPAHTKVTETILLPPGAPFTVNAAESDVDETVAATRYVRTSVVRNGVFTVTEEDQTLAPEFPAGEAAAAETRLRALAKQSVYLKRPIGYVATTGEIAAMAPKTATDYVVRGNASADAGRLDPAIADFDKAIALDPKSAPAYISRGFVRSRRNDPAGAAADAAAARAIEPRNGALLRLDGKLALDRGDTTASIQAFDQSLEVEPEKLYAFYWRSRAKANAGDRQGALRDSAAALRLSPSALDLYPMRVNLLHADGQRDAAMREADAAVVASAAVAPDNSYMLVFAAMTYAKYGRRPEAMRLLDRALAVKREPYIYLNRAEVRDPADKAGRAADVDAALAIDPKFAPALIARAKMSADAGDRMATVRMLDTLVATATPEERPNYLLSRGMALAKAGDTARAAVDFAATRALAKTPDDLNALCWAKATAGVALEAALSECDAAIATSPTPAIRDSRGLVLLRLGRLDEAIAEYGRALALAPRQAGSLYGRSVARARRGDAAGAAADRAAAIAITPDVAADFAKYGVKD